MQQTYSHAAAVTHVLNNCIGIWQDAIRLNARRKRQAL